MDYASLVHRVRELVWEHVPAGSSVAVVSKGDPALLVFDQRQGLHYPQTASGQYLGHHPESGAAAVAHLESVRERGADYLVIPSIYVWFLEYYTDLREHLNRTGELIHRDDVCAIYALTSRPHTVAPTTTAPERQLRDLLTAVLPRGSAIVALDWAYGALARQADFRVLAAPDDEAERDLAAAIRKAGGDYVVIPAPASGNHRVHDAVARKLRATSPTVLDQRHVCAVYALGQPARAGSR